MGTYGEEVTDGIGKCPKCGSLNVVEEKQSYYFIQRKEYEEDGEKYIEITNEWRGDEAEFKLTCADCNEELGVDYAPDL